MRICPVSIRYSLFAILPWAAFADTPRELIERGNENFAAGRFAEALEIYEKIVESEEADYGAELLHNRAAAHFKLGHTDDARELWVRSATMKDAAFEARARYNLGNCHYADALEAVAAAPGGQSQDLQAALDRLEQATEHYVGALRLEPELTNARANLELAQMLRNQLEQQATTQPSSQQQGQSESQPSDQRQDQSEDDQQNKGDDQQSPQSQPSSTSQQDPEKNEEQQSDQEAASQPAPPETQPAGEEPPRQQPLVPIEMTPEEAERLLQKIRDMERARRRELARREAAKYQPVKRDW